MFFVLRQYRRCLVDHGIDGTVVFFSSLPPHEKHGTVGTFLSHAFLLNIIPYSIKMVRILSAVLDLIGTITTIVTNSTPKLTEETSGALEDVIIFPNVTYPGKSIFLSSRLYYGIFVRHTQRRGKVIFPAVKHYMGRYLKHQRGI